MPPSAPSLSLPYSLAEAEAAQSWASHSSLTLGWQNLSCPTLLKSPMLALFVGRKMLIISSVWCT